MLNAPTLSRGALLVALVGAATGCAGLQGANGNGYPSQDCVESALRRSPDVADLPLAAQHFSKACRQGSAGACSTQGVLHELGLGMPVNKRRAIELYQHACRGRNDLGCVNLAQLLTGVGETKFVADGAGLLNVSCQRGHAPACGALGALYVRGAGVPSDEAKATELLQRACDGKHHPSCVSLARLFEAGSRRADIVSLVQLYEKACTGGEAEGCTRLATGYERAGAPQSEAMP